MANSSRICNGLLDLEFEKSGNKVKVTARSSGELKHIDSIDPSSAHQRRRFVKGLAAKLPEVDGQEVNNELLRLADAILSTPDREPAGAPQELDTTRIVRPELFITAEVSGLTVPVVMNRDRKPSPEWLLYLRWSDGRREYRELSNCIDLPGDAKLWLQPIPGEPSMSAVASWSAAARRGWQNGSLAPNPAELFSRLCEQVAHFIDLPADVAPGITGTLVLWSMLTHVYQAWDSIPYLFIGGPMGSGKTRVFEILSRLARRPLQTSNLTAAALFRTVHDRGGTLLFDEAERLRQATPDVQEIMSMLLAGYKRGGQATRLEPVGDTFRTIGFDVYAPKALACIAGLPPALASRSIQIAMFRASPDSPKPQRRIDADPAAWQRLRDDLHALSLEHGAVWLDLPQRTDVCPKGMNGRAYELWQPLLSLAWWIESHGADGLLALMQGFALGTIEGSKDDQIPDADETLLEVLTDKLRNGAIPTPAEILERAKELDSVTFDRWQPRTVSNRLKLYKIVARKVDCRREFRDVTLADLARIQRHYGIVLGIADSASSALESASPSSRIVPNHPQPTLVGSIPGRNGTQRDAD